jgi:glycosyltransferase involved in cell wall biosynthesis
MVLKVCQLCAVDFTLQHFLVPLVDGMRRRGWEVISVCSDGEHVPGLRERGYPVTTIPISRSMNVLSHLVSLWQLFRYFRQQRFDVVHVHTPVASLVGRFAARLAGVPLIVYTAHGFYFHEGMPLSKRRLFVGLERIAGRVTHLLFTQSREDAETAIAERISPADRVLAIGNGVDVARFDPAVISGRDRTRREFGIPVDAQVVGIIGRMVREKGYGEFLAAAARLAKASDKVYFLVVGGRLDSDHDDSIAAVLDQAVSALGARLVIAGFRADTPEMLAAMDVFCLPSYREGMPRTIIEAMMMSRPVVATDIRGSREEVVDGVTGLLVPVRSVDGLVDAFLRLLNDPDAASAMGLAGRQRALALYDEAKVVDLQLETISRCARQRGLVA